MPMGPDDQGTLPQVLGQLLGIGYAFTLLSHLLRPLNNPAWRLLPNTAYDTRQTAKVLEHSVLMFGFTCGSPNFLRRLSRMNRPDVV